MEFSNAGLYIFLRTTLLLDRFYLLSYPQTWFSPFRILSFSYNGRAGMFFRRCGLSCDSSADRVAELSMNKPVCVVANVQEAFKGHGNLRECC